MRGEIGCNFGYQITGSCHNMSVWRAVNAHPELYTTRLSIKKVPFAELTIDALASNQVRAIKGLYIVPGPKFKTFEGVEQICSAPQKMICFGRPLMISSQNDYQHMDLARGLGFTYEKDARYVRKVDIPESRFKQVSQLFETPDNNSDHYEFKQGVDSEQISRLGLPEVLQISLNSALSLEPEQKEDIIPGVWGFSLTPFIFTKGHSTMPFTWVEFDNDRQYKIVVDQATAAEMLDDQGYVDLKKARDIKYQTAERFWEKRIYAFLFRTDVTRVNEIWAVWARSGATGNIPESSLGLFLQTLAYHVAPEFKVFHFFEEGQGTSRAQFTSGILDVSWRKAKKPGCLQFGDKQLIDPNTPMPDNWGEMFS